MSAVARIALCCSAAKVNVSFVVAKTLRHCLDPHQWFLSLEQSARLFDGHRGPLALPGLCLGLLALSVYHAVV